MMCNYAAVQAQLVQASADMWRAASAQFAGAGASAGGSGGGSDDAADADGGADADE